MPAAFRPPGVYVEEIPVGARTITGVATSITAFVGRALRGPVEQAVTINGFGDFEANFGGLWNDSALGFAVRDFFLNGGRQAVIVRLFRAGLDADDSGSGGLPLTLSDFLPANGEAEGKGLYALEQVDLFNLLCIPPYHPGSDGLDLHPGLVAAAASYCEKRRAMLLLDSPSAWTSAQAAREGFTSISGDPIGTRSRNAALFFPRLRQPNPLRDDGQFETFAACGAVAGVFARTDANRGVWKAPAGLDATLVGVPRLSVPLTDAENGELNPLGINCLRSLPVAGRVVWGARTLRGADQLADEYRYIPVRRTALFIEESLSRGLAWAAFERNEEPLWAQIRLDVGNFMHDLFRRGAFQGRSPDEAWFVRCGRDTTTQGDISQGVVNVEVGFAPLRPAEFVALRIRQAAGQEHVARRVAARATWSDLALGDSALDPLRQIAAQVRERQRARQQRGSRGRSNRDPGVSVLFAGEDGAGRAMAAEAIAKDLGLPLYRIDLSQVVGKYIGETEKNLSRIFDAAAQGDAVLLFDEADALFGRRSEVRDSHDRYANVEVGYLLQRMEAFPGLVIVASNRKSSLDPAFLRRLRFVVDLP